MKLFIYLLLISITSYSNVNLGKDFSFTKISFEDLKSKLTDKVLGNDRLLTKIDFENISYNIDYTIDEKLNEKVKRIMKKYRSDYTAVAVIDNNTGKVLSLADYSKKKKSFGINLTISNTHPAASVFKIITAADLLQKKKVSPNKKYSYYGRGVTLYKNQLKDKKNRWTRAIKLKKAFAFSNNVVFGKAAIKDSDFESLKKTSSKFGFNENVLQFLDVPDSKILSANTSYELAELASGFNRKTSISPLHAAAMTSLIVNDGIEKKPYLVSTISDTRIKETVWQSKKFEQRELSLEVARDLREMMRLTVKSGTARGSFRKRKLPKVLRKLEIGGKTGTITGGLPFGKRDWFVSYAIPKDSDDLGISVAVMIINQKKWYIKAPVIAKDIMNYYYTKVK